MDDVLCCRDGGVLLWDVLLSVQLVLLSVCVLSVHDLCVHDNVNICAAAVKGDTGGLIENGVSVRGMGVCV